MLPPGAVWTPLPDDLKLLQTDGPSALQCFLAPTCRRGSHREKKARSHRFPCRKKQGSGGRKSHGAAPLPFNSGGEWTSCPPPSCCRPRQHDPQRSKEPLEISITVCGRQNFEKGSPKRSALIRRTYGCEWSHPRSRCMQRG